MKKASILLLFVLFSLPLVSQVPEKISFQAVVRDAGQLLVTSQQVGVRISILQGSVVGSAQYVETHTEQTNANGLLTLEIGTGTVVSGDFTSIDWSAGPYFIKTETDITGGTNYSIVGTSQILSVPFAFYAQKAESAIETDPVFSSSVAAGILAADTASWNNKLDSYTETDPLFAASVASGITTSNISNWNTAFGWGDHAAAGYAPSAHNHSAANITSGVLNIARIPIGTTGSTVALGNHTHAQYLTSEADPTWSGSADQTGDITRTGSVGIGTTSPAALLHTAGTGSGEGNVLFVGTRKSIAGNPPASGAGTRMMWYPDKAAFRAGQVTGSHWDKDSIGFHSVAMGYNCKASGHYAVAMGDQSIASGLFALSIGRETVASGISATALGNNTLANGSYSTSMGSNTIASSAYEISIGRYNTTYTPSDQTDWDNSDRLFVVGRGTSNTNRIDAFTIMKDGNTGIGVSQPKALLHVSSSSTGCGNILFEGSFKTTPGDPPTTGTGTRMMWYPDKAAFRVGRVFGNTWDKDSIGNHSVAMGYGSNASGSNSFAVGYYCSARGGGSIAMGDLSVASGGYSVAIGDRSVASNISSFSLGTENIASGYFSMALGYYTTASGDYSITLGGYTQALGYRSMAIGERLTAYSAFETVMGRYNTDYSPASTTMWHHTDRLLVVGRGTSHTNRIDAFTIMKNGNTGINVSDPDHTLTVMSASTAEPNNTGIGIINPSTSSYWNLHMSTAWFRLSYNGTNVAYIDQSGNYITTSDSRLKENITPMPSVLDDVLQLNVVNYHYAHDPGQNICIGLLAQETKQLFPSLVSQENPGDMYGINYMSLSVVAVKAIQEQQEKIEEQQGIIDEQQDEILRQQIELEAISARLSALEESLGQ